MDANGLRFWMLADAGDWQADADTAYENRVLRLRSQRALPPLPDSASADVEADARERIERVPQTRDDFDTRAYWDEVLGAVMSTGAFSDSVAIYAPEIDSVVTSLAMGYDGVLYMAIKGAVVLLDRRDRWEPVTLTAEGFSAWRLAADPRGGVWALDRDSRRIARVRGLPLPTRPYAPYSANVFRPKEENPDPPRLIMLDEATWPGDETPVALACSPRGHLALLTWAVNEDARLRILSARGEWDAPMTLNGARFPYSLAWVNAEEVAVLLTNLPTEAPAYPAFGSAALVDPVGDFYPLRDHTGDPFLTGITLPPHYRSSMLTLTTSPLYHLSLPSYATRSEAVNRPLIDSGDSATAWHRLYIEAVMPPNCGLSVFVAATDDEAPPTNAADWHEHRFGDGRVPGLPHGAWMPASEIPFHAGLLACAPQKDRAGVFTALIQRSNRPVRTLRGRYLWLRVELRGDGRTTPELAAVRAYGSRFSYVSRYLPELYHETAFGPDANTIIPVGARSTPADFLERFIDNFEGILTPLEDRIASAYLLTDPRTTHEDALEWLGSWIGMAFDPAYPPNRRRRLLEAAPELFQYRGTAHGLALALEIATGGGVSGGEVVLLEDFRLRRTFATILGADFADEDDPLMAGLVNSGNSYVGDTLFLGDEHRREFLALFSADFDLERPGDAAAIAALFDNLAHRVTVLVHEEVEPQDLGLIRRVVDLETPAHVQAQVISASRGFVIGMAALVGMDTYLGKKRKPGPVEIGRSALGLYDLLQHPPSLDPRLGGGVPDIDAPQIPRPEAAISAPATVEAGQSFTLDASASRSRSAITDYIWMWDQDEG